MASALVVATIAAVLVVVTWRRSGSSRPELPEDAPTPAYEVTYQTTFASGGGATREHRVVDLPFHSRSDTVDATGKTVAGSLSNDGGFFTLDASTGVWALVSEGAQRAASDPQPLPALRYAVAHGLARVLGTRTIAGRVCTLARTGAPFGELLAAETEANHVDVCVDASGVMLEYEWTVGGTLTQHTTATAFDPQPVIASDVFAAPPNTRRDAPAIIVSPLTAEQFRPFPALVPPEGFTMQTAYVSSDATHQRDTRTVATFTRDSRTVTVTFGSAQPPSKGTDTIDLGNARIGVLDVRLDSTSLTVSVAPSVTVTVLGAAPDDVVAFGRGLQRP